MKFLELPSDERRLYIERAAARRNVPEVMLEKDVWVSRVLAALRHDAEGADGGERANLRAA